MEEPTLTWYNAIDLGIRGGGWQVPDLATPFRRLPSRAELLCPNEFGVSPNFPPVYT